MHLRMFRKIKHETAATTNIAAIFLAIAVHIMVIIQVIPYDWINGGRSHSLQEQQHTSMISIVILIIMVLVNLWSCRAAIRSKGLELVRVTILWMLFAYSILGTVMQLFGTPFEQICMSVLCLVNAVMYFRLAISR